jgi:hypothetical protein
MNTDTATEPTTGELDAKGNSFDASKHLPRKHPHTGRWMPRGGRKPKLAPAPAVASLDASPAAETPPSDQQPGQPIPADTPPASSPEPAPSFADIEHAAGKDTPPAPDAKPGNAELVDDKDATLSPEDTGELASRALYAVTGAIVGDHKKAAAVGAEHANIKRVAAAYCRHRGFAVVGGLALTFTVLAYFLGDARREAVTEKFKALFARKSAPKPVSAPAVAPSAPDKTAADGSSGMPAGIPPLATS